MRSYLVSIALLFSSLSYGEVIKCKFVGTEMTSLYSMTSFTLNYKAPTQAKPTVEKNVLFRIKEAGNFELVGRGGKILQKINLNHKGRDGVTDLVYPYEVKDMSGLLPAGSRTGGCVSTYLKAVFAE